MSKSASMMTFTSSSESMRQGCQRADVHAKMALEGSSGLAEPASAATASTTAATGEPTATAARA